MKKLGMILMLVLGMMVLMAGAAFAAGPHGGYTTNTDACAGCHVTHAAKGAKLLMASTQTAFCYVCHGDNASGSSLNEQSGINENFVDATGVPTNEASNAGGFSAAFSSTHKLDYANAIPGANTGTALTGGGYGITGGLQCGSCHNPHGSNNARILKSTVNGVTLTNAVSMTVDGTKNEVTGYVSGIADFCGACHGKFNKAQGSGHTLGTDTMYRHAMGVNATLPTGATTGKLNAPGTPLESGKVVCLTCHRAHGTTATMSGYAANNFWRDGDTGTAPTGNGSVLLRMNNRGVCFNCHGAASNNLPQ